MYRLRAVPQPLPLKSRGKSLFIIHNSERFHVDLLVANTVTGLPRCYFPNGNGAHATPILAVEASLITHNSESSMMLMNAACHLLIFHMENGVYSWLELRVTRCLSGNSTFPVTLFLGQISV